VRDPGWGQAQMAWRTLVGLVAGMATGYFVAPALGLPTLLGLTFGGLLGLLPGLLVADAPAGELASSLAWYLPSFALGELLGIWLAPHQAAGLSSTPSRWSSTADSAATAWTAGTPSTCTAVYSTSRTR
jgi:hypothetical protein